MIMIVNMIWKRSKLGNYQLKSKEITLVHYLSWRIMELLRLELDLTVKVFFIMVYENNKEIALEGISNSSSSTFTAHNACPNDNLIIATFLKIFSSWLPSHSDIQVCRHFDCQLDFILHQFWSWDQYTLNCSWTPALPYFSASLYYLD